MGILGNSEDHLVCTVCSNKRSSGTRVYLNFEIIACDPLICKMNNPRLVSDQISPKINKVV